MSRDPLHRNQFGGRVEPILFESVSSSKKRGSQEPKPRHSIQMASRSTVLSNAFIELSQTRDNLECIREDDGGHASQQSTTADLFTVPTNRQKSRNHSPVSSDCRWGLVDDESQSGHEDKKTYKKICVMISVVCFISIGGLLLTALMLVGFISSPSGCTCSTSNQVPRQSELQKQVKEMDQMERNVSEILNTMRKQNEELQRLWILLKDTREELRQLKPKTETPVSMTTEETKPTQPSSLNTTNMTSGVTPSNTPFVDPIQISLTQLWEAHNESVQEITKLNFEVRNISLIPGPIGPTGRKGPRGSPGPLGPNGRPGKTGTQGPMGLRGYNGTRGLTGDQGPPGPQGPKGNQGPDGPQGPVGPRGYNGSRGLPGQPGVTGPRGNPGNTGPLGPNGRPGKNGTRGPVGPQGPMGLRGYNGTRGLTGDQGPPGPQGPKGNQGPDGPQGPVGPRGYNGSRGLPGQPGVTGPRGNPGNTGSRGTQGPQGSQGPAGPPGPRGAGNFSQCIYKRADSSGTRTSTTAFADVLVAEPAGRRIIGTVCSTNNAQETMLESVLRPGERRYACSCRGLSNHFNRRDSQMYCYLHYWECPLST